MAKTKAVKFGCSSCGTKQVSKKSSADDILPLCVSIATLEGTFTRDDGVVFTASMTANGSGETACDAKEQSTVNISATLENFLATYTPTIVSQTYTIDYDITCDGVPTCCDNPCDKYLLKYTLHGVVKVATATMPDENIFGVGDSSIISAKSLLHTDAEIINPIGDSVSSVTALYKSVDYTEKVNATSYGSEFYFNDTSVDAELINLTTNISTPVTFILPNRIYSQGESNFVYPDTESATGYGIGKHRGEASIVFSDGYTVAIPEFSSTIKINSYPCPDSFGADFQSDYTWELDQL
jgi:hypothetical protein